jgi:hypothetical protein
MERGTQARAIHLSPELALPLDVVTQRLAFLARTGAGKTYAAGKLVEELLDNGAQVVVLDPVGNWYGLRLAADGKSPGIPIPVVGGEHGDLPLDAAGGALIADLVVEQGVSLVVDVSMFRKGQRRGFVTAFAEQLFHRKKSQRSPLHIVLEEAQAFCPQKVQHGEERMLGAVEDIIKLGRNYGVGVSLISQRPQAVNKDALNQAEILVVLQMNGPQERAALKAWITEHGVDVVKELEEVPRLPVGTAFVWSPQFLRFFGRVAIGQKRTFDASATPKFGASISSRSLVPVDLGELRAAMERLGASKDDDAGHGDGVKALRRRVAALEEELRVARAVPPAPSVPPVDLDWLRTMVAHARTTLDEIAGAIDAKVVAAAATSSTPTQRVVDQAQRPPAAPRLASQLKLGARVMLDTLASFHPRALSRRQLATLARMSPTSGTFSDYLSSLRRAGFIVDTDNDLTLTITPAGIANAIAARPASTKDLVARWSSKLKAGARRMLDALVARHPTGLSRVALAAAAGIVPTSGTFSDYLSSLRRNGLIDERGRYVFASPSLFMATEDVRAAGGTR